MKYSMRCSAVMGNIPFTKFDELQMYGENLPQEVHDKLKAWKWVRVEDLERYIEPLLRTSSMPIRGDFSMLASFSTLCINFGLLMKNSEIPSEERLYTYVYNPLKRNGFPSHCVELFLDEPTIVADGLVGYDSELMSSSLLVTAGWAVSVVELIEQGVRDVSYYGTLVAYICRLHNNEKRFAVRRANPRWQWKTGSLVAG